MSLEISMIKFSKDKRTVEDDVHVQEVRSGHFMVSNLDDSDEESPETEDASFYGDIGDLAKAKEEVVALKDGNRLAFENLTSLFKYLKIAYTGKLTSPKWNQFRGLRFAIKSKIRLNNIIWREFHMQYVKKKRPVIVQFQAPLTESHTRIEAIVMEGKYWKRHLSALSKEYSHWRIFAKNKIQGRNQKQLSVCMDELLDASDFYAFLNNSYELTRNLPPVDLNELNLSPTKLLEEIMMDLDENVDLNFEQPITFPNPRELPTLGNADIMQPGLMQLQPDHQTFIKTCSPGILQSTSAPSLITQESKSGFVSDVSFLNLFGCCPTTESAEARKAGRSAYSTNNISPHYAETRTQFGIKEVYPVSSQSVYSSQPYMVDSCSPQGQFDWDVTNAKNALSLNNSNLDPEYYSVHPYLPSFTVPHKRQHFSHPLKGPMTRHSHTIKHHPITSPSGRRLSSINPVPHKNRSSRPVFLSFDQDSLPITREINEPRNETPTLLNALLYGTENSKKDFVPPTDLNAFDSAHEPTRSAPLLCGVLKSSDSKTSNKKQVKILREVISESTSVESDCRSLNKPSNGSSLRTNIFRKSFGCNAQSTHMEDTKVVNARTAFEVSTNVTRPFITAQNANNNSSDIKAFRFIKPSNIEVSNNSSFPTVHNLLVKNLDSNSCTTKISSEFHFNKFGSTSQPNMNRPDPKCGYPFDVPLDQLLNLQTTTNDNIAPSMPPMHLLSQTNAGLANVTQTGHRQRTISDNECSNSSPQFCTVHLNNPICLPHETTAACLESGVSEMWDPSRSLQPSELQIAPNRLEQITVNARDNVNTAQTRVGSDNLMEGSTTSSATVLSVRGRSNSVGNLLGLKQSLAHSSKTGSTATLSSCESDDNSPTPTHQKSLSYAHSSSCSPPLIDAKDSTIGSSTEERRRHSIQTALQTLKQLITMHSTIDGSFGGSRLAARKRMENLETLSQPICHSSTDEPCEKYSQISGAFEHNLDEIGGTGRASKAATLRNAAELIRNMRDQRNALDAKCKTLREEMEALQTALNKCYEKLPPSGSAPILQPTDQHLTNYCNDWFRVYVHKQTQLNWKFYIFSLILEDLYRSFCTSTVINSRDHFIRSVYGWLDTHCSLLKLRPAVMRAVLKLSTSTTIFHEPNQLPEQARATAANLWQSNCDRAEPN